MLPADDTSPSGTQYLPRVCGYINFVEELLVSFVTIIGLHPLCNNKKSIWAYENSFCLLPYFTIYFYLVRKPFYGFNTRNSISTTIFELLFLLSIKNILLMMSNFSIYYTLFIEQFSNFLIFLISQRIIYL